VRRHAAATYLGRFYGDVSTDDVAALVFDSPHEEVRAAAADAVRAQGNWDYSPTLARRLVPALDSPEPALRQLALRTVLRQHNIADVIQPRELVARLDSPHKDVRDAVTEHVWRKTVSRDREAEPYVRHIGLATAKKLQAMQNGAPPPPPANKRPWTTPAAPAPAKASVTSAADAASADWLTWLTAALGTSLVATLGGLLAAARFTARITPPPPPVEYRDETPGWMRRAA
jgi:hypothetical protein